MELVSDNYSGTGHSAAGVPSNNTNNTVSNEDSVIAFQSKKMKMTDEERLTRCRERNRVHARNTRERKKEQSELLELKIKELSATVILIDI